MHHNYINYLNGAKIGKNIIAPKRKGEKFMILEEKDYYEMADLLEEGCNQLEFEKDGELLVVDYEYSEDGYYEDDYHNGTGAFVCTNKELYIKNVACYNADGEIVSSDFNQTLLIRKAA